MATILDLRKQIDAVDRQVVELLSRRQKLVKQVLIHLDEDEPDKEREQQVLSNWLEHGFDFDLDESSLGKIANNVMEMGRKAKDS